MRRLRSVNEQMGNSNTVSRRFIILRTEIQKWLSSNL